MKILGKNFVLDQYLKSSLKVFFNLKESKDDQINQNEIIFCEFFNLLKIIISLYLI